MSDAAVSNTQNHGAPPKLAWLDVAALSADPSYQRSVEGRNSQMNIRRIANHFTWALFGAATVADTPEGYRVIDGQHRIEAARRVGITEVPCLLVEGLDTAAQARLFVDSNKYRVGLTPLALHHALVAAGDKTATMIDEACAQAGVEVLRYPLMASKIKSGQTMAIGAIGIVFRQFGGDVLCETLRLVVKHWPNPGGVTMPRIRAVANAIGQLGADAVDAAIGSIGADEVDRAAEGAAELGLPRFRLMADVIAGRRRPGARKSPAPCGPARPARSAAPAVRPEEIPDEIEELLTAPVLRRCERCRQAFKTRRVQQYCCERCAAKEREAAS